MSTPASTARASVWLRWWRAAVVAVVATTLGVVAHVSAGGLLPSGMSMAVVVGCLTVVAAASLDRPGTRTVLVTLVAGGQFVVHLVLTATAGHTGPHGAVSGGITSPSTSPGRGSVRDALTATTSDGLPTDTVAGPPSWLAHVIADLSGANAAMALGHLLAAGVVALWLWTGEDALWTLIALLGGRPRVALSLVITTPGGPGRPERVPVTPAMTLRRRRAATSGPTGRRGPPVSPAFTTVAPAA